MCSRTVSYLCIGDNMCSYVLRCGRFKTLVGTRGPAESLARAASPWPPSTVPTHSSQPNLPAPLQMPPATPCTAPSSSCVDGLACVAAGSPATAASYCCTGSILWAPGKWQGWMAALVPPNASCPVRQRWHAPTGPCHGALTASLHLACRNEQLLRTVPPPLPRRRQVLPPDWRVHPGATAVLLWSHAWARVRAQGRREWLAGGQLPNL